MRNINVVPILFNWLPYLTNEYWSRGWFGYTVFMLIIFNLAPGVTDFEQIKIHFGHSNSHYRFWHLRRFAFIFGDCLWMLILCQFPNRWQQLHWNSIQQQKYHPKYRNRFFFVWSVHFKMKLRDHSVNILSFTQKKWAS